MENSARCTDARAGYGDMYIVCIQIILLCIYCTTIVYYFENIHM